MSRWRFPDFMLALLVVLFIFTVWGGIMPKKSDTVQPAGVDFLQFYAAGLVAHRGEIDRLYDQPYFRDLQRPWKEEGLFSLYPPTMALMMMPLARLSYDQALAAWWAIQAVCFLAAGCMLYRMMSLERLWRIAATMALCSLFPVAIAVRMGHLSPLLLVLLVGGISLHRQGRPGAAGMVLSLLALKPQLAVGLLLWMFLRRDRRTIAGMAAGGLAQAGVVAIAFGPGVWLDYLHAMPTVTCVARTLFRYSAIFEQSFPGIVDNLLWLHDVDRGVRTTAMMSAYVLTGGAAALLLFRVIAANRPWDQFLFGLRERASAVRSAGFSRFSGAEPPEGGTTSAGDYEYVCGVLFLMLFPPYLLVYDLTLLALPLALLWSSPRWRTGVALYATATVPAAALYYWTGFSLTGVVALWTMFELSLAVAPLGRVVSVGPRFDFRET